MSSKIITKNGRSHNIKDLVALFQELTDEQISQLLTILRIQDIVGSDQYRTLQITSNTEKILDGTNLPNNIVLEANMYNYFSNINSTVDTWIWKRNSGSPTEDNAWEKNTSSITITAQDLTQRIYERDVSFIATAIIEGVEYTSEFTFSTSQNLSTVRIDAEAMLFVGENPSSILLKSVGVGLDIESCEWFLENTVVSVDRNYVLYNNTLPMNSVANIRLVATSTRGTTHVATISIAKLQQGGQGPAGPAGQDGAPGVPGTDAPILRMLNWEEGRTYLNNTIFKDYIYYRPTDKWYKLKNNVSSKVAPADPATDADFEITVDVQGSILAENANIGGWIMRGNMLYSQAGLVLGQDGYPVSANIILNGLTGEIIFGNNRAVLNMSGLFFRDANQRPRITASWNQETGVPRLYFQDENGNITWEAGREYTPWITQGTTVPSWGVDLGARKITSLANDPDLVFNTLNTDLVKSFITSHIASAPNSYSSTRLLEDQGAYFTVGAFPKTSPYSLTNNIGYVNLLDKGDIAANADLIEGYYRIKTPIRPSNLPSDNLLPNSWYLLESVSGYNGAALMANLVSENQVDHVARIVYISNGVITREETIVVHRQNI